MATQESHYHQKGNFLGLMVTPGGPLPSESKFSCLDGNTGFQLPSESKFPWLNGNTGVPLPSERKFPWLDGNTGIQITIRKEIFLD